MVLTWTSRKSRYYYSVARSCVNEELREEPGMPGTAESFDTLVYLPASPLGHLEVKQAIN